MYYIGVDPGKTGGIAILSSVSGVHGVLGVTPMIIAGSELDLSAITDWVYSYVLENNAICYIEKVSAMPKQGVTSMFNFGFSTGAIHGIIASMEIPRYLVTPTQWKRKVLTETNWKKNKKASVDYCRRAYPHVPLTATERSRVAHLGMADALCIATYGFITEERHEL